MEEQLKACLGLLKGPSDEHKFAGLLILSKILQVHALGEDELLEIMQQVVSAVGVSFLIRLAKTEPELTLNLMEKLSYVGSVLEPVAPLLKGSTDEIVPILCRITSSPTSPQLLTAIFELSNFELMQSLLSARTSETSVIRRVVEEFVKPGPRQLYLQPVVLLALETQDPELLKRTLEADPLRRGVIALLKGKLKMSYRNNALLICSRLFDLLGPNWLASSDTSKDVSLLAKLCYIEVKMALDTGDDGEVASVCLHILDEILVALVDEFVDWAIDPSTINILRETFNDTGRLLIAFMTAHEGGEEDELNDKQRAMRPRIEYELYVFLSRLLMEDEQLLRPEAFELFQPLLHFLFREPAEFDAKAYICLGFLATLLADPGAAPSFLATDGVPRLLTWLAAADPSHPGFVPGCLSLVHVLHVNPPPPEQLAPLLNKLLRLPTFQTTTQTLLLLTEILSSLPRKATAQFGEAQQAQFVELLGKFAKRHSADELFLDSKPIILEKLLIVSTRHTLPPEFEPLMAQLKAL